MADCSYGKVIKKKLIDKGLTQTELAISLGCSRQYLNRIVSGNRGAGKYKKEIDRLLGIN